MALAAAVLYTLSNRTSFSVWCNKLNILSTENWCLKNEIQWIGLEIQLQWISEQIQIHRSLFLFGGHERK